MREAHGVCTASRVILTDITTLKDALEDLRNSKVSFEAILHATTESVLLIDTEGRILALNIAAAESLGGFPHEFIGKSIYDFLQSEVGQKRHEQVDAVKIGGKPVSFEDERRGDVFEHNLYPVVDADGKVAKIAIFARRITRQRLAERKERDTRERLRAVFESTSECIFIIDADMRYTQVNPAVTNLFGIPESEIIGRRSEDLYGEEAGKQVSEFNARVLKGETIEHEHVRTIRGTPLVFLDTRVPLRDDQGRIVGACCLSRIMAKDKAAYKSFKVDYMEYPSSAMRDTLKLASSAARSRGVVLLTGESGSGKDYLASWIHTHSSQASGPFVSVNSAALPRELAESELFGHERGAFTGATIRKKGQLELAEGGTILLNEIGELDLSVQAKLLAFLDTNSFLRVGGEKPVRVNARLIAATHRDLLWEVSEGRFLEPLFYRLSVFPIKMPALRDRLQDIPLLVRQIMSEVAAEMQLSKLPTIEEAHFRRLSRYHWPGNVRELRNTIERSLMLWHGGSFRLVIGDSMDNSKDPGIHIQYAKGKTLREFHREVTEYLCEQALRRCKGRKTEAAELLGISRDAFYRYVKKLHIKS